MLSFFWAFFCLTAQRWVPLKGQLQSVVQVCPRVTLKDSREHTNDGVVGVTVALLHLLVYGTEDGRLCHRVQLVAGNSPVFETALPFASIM